MDRRTWLLVEWVDERNIFPVYGVVNLGSLVSSTNDIHPGKIVFISSRYSDDSRRAQILRISDDKRQVKEYKMFLERQDHQVKNVISMCMRTIKEMRTDHTTEFGIPTKKHEPVAGPSGTRTSAVPHVVADTDSDTSDDNDTSSSVPEETRAHKNKNRTKYLTNGKRAKQSLERVYSSLNVFQKRPMTTSTPLPVVNDSAKITADKQTQTEDTSEEKLAKLKELEDGLIDLYNRYLILEGSLQNRCNERRDGNVQPMNVSEGEGIQSTGTDREQAVETANGNVTEGEARNSNVEEKVNEQVSNSRTLHVRRVSAQTTNNADTSFAARSSDMVPIGNGNVVVPARLMRDINWDSYSTATRLLLQAAFPRKVLATHSLSGKASPAFAHRPPKKQLDANLVDDIVNTVSQRCGVAKRLVRNSITIKCTDEAKLYRNRLHGRRIARVNCALANQENVPPSPSSHESSTNTNETD